MSRRITYVVHQFLPRYFTGTEQYVLAIAKQMQARGHDVEVIALEPDFSEQDTLFEWREEEVEGLKVQRLRFWMVLDRSYQRMDYTHPFIAERVRSHLERRQPDLLHAFHLRYLGADLIREARMLGIPSVVHLMDFWFLCPAVTLMRGDGSLCDGPPDGGLGCVSCLEPGFGEELDRRGLREILPEIQPVWPRPSRPWSSPVGRIADRIERPDFLREHLMEAGRVVAPSRFLRDRFVANGYPEDRFTVMGYGVDAGRLAGLAARPARAVGDPLRCGFIGSIAHHKGTDLAIDAVLRSQGGIELAVFGRTSDFPQFADPLVKRAAGDARISFPGPFASERLGEVMAGLDLLLVPSRWYENTPFVVLEAFAAGVPVIASDLGGMSELVEDEVNGELFAPGDAGDLARRLTRLAGEPERLDRYRQALPAVKTLLDNAGEIEAMYGELWSDEAGARTIRRQT